MTAYFPAIRRESFLSNMNIKTSQIKLIVGLGNPGKQYEATRHNAGFWFIDRIVNEYRSALIRKEKFFGYAGTATVEGMVIHLLKPDTMMNLSGRSVQAFAAFYRIDIAEILVAHDELDIGYGEVRLKTSGGHGGHNGLRDIVQRLGSKDFHRLRIGIDHPGHASQVTGHVLGNPRQEERKLIESAIDMAVNELPKIIKGDFETVMQQLHAKQPLS